MEKTIEEMKAAVIAYCEEVCPDSRYKSLNPLGLTRIPAEKMHGYNLDGVDVAWAIMYRGDVVCFLYDGTSSDLIDFAHRLFGLEARDTVQAERSRLSKRYKSRLNRLRANDAETHRIQIEVKDERIAALQAKSAALVEALEEIKKVHGFAYTYGDGFSNVTDKRLNSTGVAIEKVIEAHKKGGVQG